MCRSFDQPSALYHGVPGNSTNPREIGYESPLFRSDAHCGILAFRFIICSDVHHLSCSTATICVKPFPLVVNWCQSVDNRVLYLFYLAPTLLGGRFHPQVVGVVAGGVAGGTPIRLEELGSVSGKRCSFVNIYTGSTNKLALKYIARV